MNLDDIKKLLHGSHPFRIRMVSGRIIDVPHQDFAALTQSGSLMFSTQSKLVEVIRLSQIESIEMHEDAASA